MLLNSLHQGFYVVVFVESMANVTVTHASEAGKLAHVFSNSCLVEYAQAADISAF